MKGLKLQGKLVDVISTSWKGKTKYYLIVLDYNYDKYKVRCTKEQSNTKTEYLGEDIEINVVAKAYNNIVYFTLLEN